MRKKITALQLALYAFLAYPAIASSASLIGDSVLFKGCYPTTLLCTEPIERTVEAGDSDSFQYGISFTDVDEDSILVTLVGAPGPAEFNGVVVFGLDWVSEPDRIIDGVSVSSTIVGFHTGQVSFGEHFVQMNFGASTTSGSAVIYLSSINTALVPLPPALILAASAFGVLLVQRRTADK